jgi:uncharacterized protein YpmB
MPGFISVFIVLFFAVFVSIIILMVKQTKKMNQQNNTPIKQFSVEGKKYLIFSKQTNSYYSHNVIYELRNSNNIVIGSFNSLNDILVLLNIDKFPSEDIFG